MCAFIVFEGIDGAGGETQSKILKEKLEILGKEVVLLRYPDGKHEIGKFIYMHLEKRNILTPESLLLLFLADFAKDKEKIIKAMKNGKIVIADRYFTSTIVYQHAQGIELSKILSLAEIINIPKPDIAIFLKISPEISMKRKLAEKGFLDNFEKNFEFLRKVSRIYEEVAKKNIFCKWAMINGERSIEEVSKNVWKIIENLIC